MHYGTIDVTTVHVLVHELPLMASSWQPQLMIGRLHFQHHAGQAQQT